MRFARVLSSSTAAFDKLIWRCGQRGSTCARHTSLDWIGLKLIYLLISLGNQRCCHNDRHKQNKMAGEKEKKRSVDLAVQQAILEETVRKEERYQKLFTNYSINPFKKSKSFHFCSNML